MWGAIDHTGAAKPATWGRGRAAGVPLTDGIAATIAMSSPWEIIRAGEPSEGVSVTVPSPTETSSQQTT